MTRLLVIASCALLISFVTGNPVENDADVGASANGVASSGDADDNSNGETTTEASTTTTTKPAPLTCGDNEVVDDCPVDCASDRCPESEDEAKQTCGPSPDKCPAPQCKCQFNYRRANNGTCIPTRDCPLFECDRPNEEYNSCPPICPPDDCSHATADGKCHTIGQIGIVLECAPKCRCKEGFWRKDGLCRPYADCNKECTAPNEEYNLEKIFCPPEECNSLIFRFSCKDTPPPGPDCACKTGYLRKNETSPCIPLCECPKMYKYGFCKEKTGQK